MINNYNVTKPWSGGVCFSFPDFPNRFVFIEFGNGTNDDNLSEGCDGYIIYGLLEPGKDGEWEVGGGMVEFNRATCGYDGDINKAVNDIVTSGVVNNLKSLSIKPLKRPESFFKDFRNKF